jgi:zinc D-Ala-D-Ala dipeptidase
MPILPAKTMQTYCFFRGILLCLMILTFEAISQPNDNQLFIIKNIRDYKKWLAPKPDSGLFPLKNMVKPLFAEVPYQTKKNFTGEVLYKKHSFWVTREAGEKLKLVQDSLRSVGLSLYFFDTYRPYAATVKMWKIVPDERYAANPANGSGHNRGVSVDVSLANLETGQPLPMPTGFDNFTDTAHHDFVNLSTEVLENRARLKGIMEHFGFRALATEWWHYSLPEPKRYPLLDIPFKKLRKLPF